MSKTRNMITLAGKLSTHGSIMLAIGVVAGYMLVLQAFSSHDDHESHSHNTTSENSQNDNTNLIPLHRLSKTGHVSLQAIPETQQIQSKIIQTGGSAPAKFLSFDDFIKTYKNNEDSGSQGNSGKSETANPIADNKNAVDKSLDNKAVQNKTGEVKKQEKFDFINSEIPFGDKITKPVSDNGKNAAQQEIPTGDFEFNSLMNSQSEQNSKIKLESQEAKSPVFSPSEFDAKPVKPFDNEPASKAELLIQDAKASLGNFEDKSGTTDNLDSKPRPRLSLDDQNAPRLLIGETAQSLGLPKTIVTEINKEETQSPGGLNITQVRRLLALMIREASELHEMKHSQEAARLARFAILVADESGLSNYQGDPELVNMLYLARTIRSVENTPPSAGQPVLPLHDMPLPKDQPIIQPESVGMPVAGPSSPQINPEPRNMPQHAKANESMSLPGFQTTSTQNISPNQQAIVRANPFQPAALTTKSGESASKSTEFKPFDMAPHSFNTSQAGTEQNGELKRLAFPEMNAPLPPGEISEVKDAFLEYGESEKKQAIQVQDNLVQIPEHMTYGIMLAMFMMVLVLVFRRR